jgi:hypothetical protein
MSSKINFSQYRGNWWFCSGKICETISYIFVDLVVNRFGKLYEYSCHLSNHTIGLTFLLMKTWSDWSMSDSFTYRSIDTHESENVFRWIFRQKQSIPFIFVRNPFRCSSSIFKTWSFTSTTLTFSFTDYWSRKVKRIYFCYSQFSIHILVYF